MMTVRAQPGRWQTLGLVALAALLGIQAEAADSGVEARLRKDITFLASDACEGRGVTTRGIDLAADYIAGEFKKAGLKPAPDADGYFQPFTMPGGRLESPNRLSLRGPQGQVIELKLGRHFEPLGLSHAGKVMAPVVFAGYGVTTGKDTGYDDYQDLDVAGKVVVILRDTPRADNRYASFGSFRRQRYGSLMVKMQNAEKHKAAAVLFVSDRDTARDGDELLDFGFTAAGPSPAKLPAVHLRRSILSAMLQGSIGQDLPDVEKDIDRELKPRSALLKGWTATLEINVRRSTIDLKNVVGVVEGSGSPAKETVVVGAHYDHLGYGGPGSLASLKKPAIHHGADDNGSGTAALLELARRFGRKPQQEGRRLVFMAFSGEESGLLGSEYYCKHPLFPLGDTVAMVNMDMVGRLSKDPGGWQALLAILTPVPQLEMPVLPLTASSQLVHRHLLPPRDKLIVYGTGTSKQFDAEIEQLNQKHGFQVHKVPGGFGPSDHASFYAKKIPVYFFFTGDHADYHRPSDTADKINIPGLRRVTDLVEDVVDYLVQVRERPQYVKVADTSRRPGGPIPRLGIRPSYGDEGEGVLLSGVSDGGPAAKAGLKEGDRIVEIGGKPVKNLESYMTLLAAHKKGQPIAVGCIRDGKKMTFQVTPE